jgi:hypothetical protein
VNRGEIYRIRRPPRNDPKRSRCFVIVSRQTLLDSKAARVVCAPINTTYVGLSTQVPIGIDDGLKHPSCDEPLVQRSWRGDRPGPGRLELPRTDGEHEQPRAQRSRARAHGCGAAHAAKSFVLGV